MSSIARLAFPGSELRAVAARPFWVYPSPPTSTWPLPSHFWHSPLPPQEAQDISSEVSPEASAKLSPGSLPMPWQNGQFPSPGESQSRHIWVDTLHLPSVLRIVSAFRSGVKLSKVLRSRRHPGLNLPPIASRPLVRPRKFDRSSRSRIASSEFRPP
jgi:hypothetical protein